MSGSSSRPRRAAPPPGQAPLPAPNAAALLRRNAADPDDRATGPRSGSRTGSGPTASTSPSRAGWANLFLDRLPGRPRRRTSRCCSTTRPTTSSRSAARRSSGAAVVGLNHTRRGEHLLRDVEHTHCGLVITEPRHRELLAPIARSALAAGARGRATTPRRPRSTRLTTTTDPGIEPDVDTIWALIFTCGHVGRAEGGDLLAAPAARHRQPHGHDHGPRPRRRRLRVHAAVPLERGAGRLGAVDRLRRVASGLARSSRASRLARRRPPLRLDLLQLHRQAARRTSSRTPERPDDADNPLRVAFGNEGSPEVVDEFARRFGVEVIDAYGATEGGVAVNRDAEERAGALGQVGRRRQGRRRGRQREAARPRFDAARPARQRGRVRRRDRQHRGRRAVRGLLQQPGGDREDDPLRLVLVGRPRLPRRRPLPLLRRPQRRLDPGRRRELPGRADRGRAASRIPTSCSPRSTACPTTRPATR